MANVPRTRFFESRIGTLQQARKPKPKGNGFATAHRWSVAMSVDDHRLVQERGRAARSHLRPDRKTVYPSHVIRRQTAGRSFPQVEFFFVQQQNRAKAARRHAFNSCREGIQDFLERCAFRNQLENVAFFWMNCEEWSCASCSRLDAARNRFVRSHPSAQLMAPMKKRPDQ